jgi:peptidoglycan/LPS O-acetylase OafA/YrhL
MRGIAAMGVVLTHFVCKTTGFVESENVMRIFALGELGVPLFFLISGIVIPLHMLQTNYHHKDIGVFALRRVLRVEPAYLITLVIGISFWNLRSLVYGVGPDTFLPTNRDIFLHLGYLVPFVEDARWVSPVFWTLAIEFQYYLLLACMFPLLASRSRQIQNTSIFGCLLTTAIPASSQTIFPWIPLFFTGIVSALFLLRRLNKVDFYFWLLICLVLVAVQDWKTLVVASSALGVIFFTPNASISPLAWLGKVSYSLYLIHGLTGAVFINLVSHHVNHPMMKFFVVVTGVVIALFCAWVMYVIIEAPSHQAAKRVKVKRIHEGVRLSP